MDPAFAALCGASIGAIAAIAGQALAHRFAVSRDQAQHERALIDESVAAAHDALMIADGLRVTDPERAASETLRGELHAASRRVNTALGRLEAALGRRHPIPTAYNEIVVPLMALAYLLLTTTQRQEDIEDRHSNDADRSLRAFKAITRGERFALADELAPPLTRPPFG